MGQNEINISIINYLISNCPARIGEFGSFARPEHTSKSEIDILVKFTNTKCVSKEYRILNPHIHWAGIAGKYIHLIVLILLFTLPSTAQNWYVNYSDFGAIGDGKTDDTEAIAAAHAHANEHGLPVKAGDGKKYYIGGMDLTIVIKTNTDFGTAAFIIDDTDVENRRAHVFVVATNLQPFKPDGINTLERNQEKVNISLSQSSLITVTNSHKRHYNRLGPNRDRGSAQTDIFMVDKNGNVDMNAPIIWDFDRITEVNVLPIDEKTLTITGGHFTTLANRAESRSSYYNRGFAIRRSNTVVDGLQHFVIGEGGTGAPYSGFIDIADCSYVTIKNTVLTGRKTYRTVNSVGATVPMGSYDISLTRALNVSFENCSQTNDINDSRFWGIMGSNYCKNIILDNCSFSRFDAHKGVANVTIRNSTLGHQGINAIGSGTLWVENSVIYASNLINLRSDYGSTWQGEVIICNSDFRPPAGRTARLINGNNTGQHDFGYICYLPEQITIGNLFINDAQHTSSSYNGPVLFANFNADMKDDSFVEKFPYVRNSEVNLYNVTTASGKPLRLSFHPFMFDGLKIRGLKD